MLPPSRPRSSVSASLEAVSNLHGETGYTFPPLAQLAQYRLLVTTLVTAGRLVSAAVPASHFHYIFMDEAGQVTGGALL